ncbi:MULTISPECIES: type II toxin-antitoxin system PemK/MazF family toxin [Dermacoccus]|uniref:type II toxin-antitoxin system PemK/MazF family toxin n=1 Tax=Dermacoccus TaxID=57495 RepID=UPI001050BBA3|nr:MULTISPECIES: type II toxin-antitoxin system PemK/MazF family toxin [Dermacoccus]MCG7430201.1 type II toxin-antitoxin system PemK/MazF family toxin [Dermacoccus nishinomiyaensis]TCJ92330.1 mRNA interferase MazF [Dermacoccus sp. SAI-028]
MHRGPIYRCDLGHGEKPWPVASNNARDTHLRSALVVRVTTSTKPPLPSIVPIELSGASRAGQELLGSVLCDDIEVLDDDHHVRPGSGLPPHIMQRVDAALTVALALT